MEAKIAHGASLAAELDPSGSPGIFTPIGGLNGEITISLSVASVEALEHDEEMDTFIPGGITRRGDIPISVNYNHDNTAHVSLLTLMLSKTRFKLRFRGRNGGPGVDEMIFNDGFLTSWDYGNPIGDGIRTGEGVYRPSGSMVIDGVTYG